MGYKSQQTFDLCVQPAEQMRLMEDVAPASSIGMSFDSEDQLAQLLSAEPAYASMVDSSEPGTKRHAACDECRQRKLKCSGQLTGCTRCVKHNIRCIYSQQKQMGRPRKKPRTEEEVSRPQTPPYTSQPPTLPVLQHQTLSQYPDLPEERIDTPIDPSLAAIVQEQTNFSNVCTGPIAQAIRDTNGSNVLEQQIAHYSWSNDNGDSDAANGGSGRYPLDISQWPDFSDSTLPAIVQDSADNTNSYLTPAYTMSIDGTAYNDPDFDPTALSVLPATPSCSCLPNLYLTLSTLSTLQSFPVSAQTIETLLAAHKTAHEVIYCSTCPRQFLSGSQNLMLGCTLLNVLADHWHRIRKATAEELRKGWARSTLIDSDTISMREGQTWRKFSHDIIRAYVFGDKPIPTPPSCSQSGPTDQKNSNTGEYIPSQQNGYSQPPSPKHVPPNQILIYLINALRRRQRQYHNLDPLTDEFPDRDFVDASCPYADAYAHLHPNPHDSNHSSNPTNHDHNGQSKDNDKDPDNMLCLKIVKHSMDIVRLLDDQNEQSSSLDTGANSTSNATDENRNVNDDIPIT